MPRFMLLLSPRGGPPGSPALLGARTARFMEWVARGRQTGLIRDGGCVSGCATVRCGAPWMERDGSSPSTAPTEPGERITGYLVVEADNLVAAIDVSRGCPAADPGTIVVLELDDASEIRGQAPP